MADLIFSCINQCYFKIFLLYFTKYFRCWAMHKFAMLLLILMTPLISWGITFLFLKHLWIYMLSLIFNKALGLLYVKKTDLQLQLPFVNVTFKYSFILSCVDLKVWWGTFQAVVLGWWGNLWCLHSAVHFIWCFYLIQTGCTDVPPIWWDSATPLLSYLCWRY